ncbi:MAG: hypothetical protein ACLQIQ_00855 [Beijerinckiaceae bacterium]
MARPRHFWRNERGSSFESMALALSVIAVIFVAGADLLDHASKKDGLLARIFARHGADVAQMTRDSLPLATPSQVPAGRGGVDYTATGSIIGLRKAPVLDPCTGAAKQ